MDEKSLFTRRKFLVGSAATLGGVILAWMHRLLAACRRKSLAKPSTQAGC